jgi:hypothetical protein
MFGYCEAILSLRGLLNNVSILVIIPERHNTNDFFTGLLAPAEAEAYLACSEKVRES